MKRIFLLIVMAMVVGFSAQGHATLIDRGADSAGNHLIYDSDLNITWYDYTTPFFDTFVNQLNFVSNLEVHFNGTLYDDWHVPATDDQTCFGYNCTTSEMGHLYYTELGNSAGGPLAHTGPFQHLGVLGILGVDHWSGFATTIHNADLAFVFYFNSGFQDAINTHGASYALAVRDGDVSIPVPEPASMLLLATGLAGLGVYRKRIATATKEALPMPESMRVRRVAWLSMVFSAGHAHAR